MSSLCFALKHPASKVPLHFKRRWMADQLHGGHQQPTPVQLEVQREHLLESWLGNVNRVTFAWNILEHFRKGTLGRIPGWQCTLVGWKLKRPNACPQRKPQRGHSLSCMSLHQWGATRRFCYGMCHMEKFALSPNSFGHGCFHPGGKVQRKTPGQPVQRFGSMHRPTSLGYWCEPWMV